MAAGEAIGVADGLALSDALGVGDTFDLSSPYNTSAYVLPLAIVIFGGAKLNVSVPSLSVDLSKVHSG